jgi:hypothetical protein
VKHRLLSPNIDMVETIGDYLLEEPACLQEHIIVFPGKRPIHFLRKYLAGRLKRAYFPPRMFSMDEFVDHLYEDRFRIPAPKMTEIDSIPILFSLNASQQLVNRGTQSLSLDDFMPWGFKLYGDFEELYIEQVEPERLKEVEVIAAEKVPPHIQQQLTTLSLLYERFYDEVARNGLSTRSSRYRSVADRITEFDITPYRSLVFAGFFALTASERRVFRALINNEKTTFFLQQGPHIDCLLNELEIDTKEEGTVSEPVVTTHKAADIHGEVIQLSHLLRDADTIDQRTVVVLPQADTLFPAIQLAFGFAGPSYNISMGYPLIRTPLYSLIESIGQLLDSRVESCYYVPGYLKVVLHPYIKNTLMQRSNEPTRIIFHTIEELLTVGNFRLIHLDDIVWNKDVLEECRNRLKRTTSATVKQGDIQEHLLQIHQVCIEVFEEILSIRDFCDKLMELLSFLSKKSTAQKHPYTNPYIKTMMQALYDLKISALGHETFQSTGSYFRMLRNYISQIRYPFVGTPVGGLQVLGPLETRNIRFDTVHVLDVNEGILPHTKKEDTILPLKVRKYLGLPTHEDRERISRYYFETLIHGAKNVHLLYCESEHKEKSRFIERLIWQEQKKKKTIEYQTIDVFFDVSFKHKYPEPISKTADILTYMNTEIRYSATSLNAYLRCPLQFYYLRVHNLSPQKSMSMDIDPFDRGSVVHAILEEFFIRKAGSILEISDSDYTVMERIVNAQFDRVFPYANQGALFLFKHQVQRRMRDLLHFYRGKGKAGIMVLECENRTSPDVKPEFWNALYTVPYKTRKSNEVTLSGKIDRVDQRGSDWLILDYKTGSYDEVPKKSFDVNDRVVWYRTLVSVQLPLYILLYMGKHPELPLTSVNCGLVQLGWRSIEEVFLFNDSISPEEKAILFDAYETAISALIDEILDPNLPFNPTLEPKRICPGCEYQVICGTQHLVNARR